MKFRPAALKEIGEPEKLDEPGNLAGWSKWAATGALIVTLLAVIGWGFLGTVSRSVAAQGILAFSEGITDLQAASAGRVEQVWVKPADRVVKGQHLYTYREFDGTVVHEIAPWDAYVISLLATQGQVISLGQTTATLEKLVDGRDELQVLVFLSATQAPTIRVGSTAEVEVRSAPAAAFGTLSGLVTSVGRFPETASSLRARLGSEADVERYLVNGAPVLVVIELDKDPTGELIWSRGGPPYLTMSQSDVTATFLISQQRPVDWVIRRW